MPGEMVYFGSSGSDPARIAAQVVSGIGFLGAGAIMSTGGKIRGLTTAASLWAVAAIGLCVGCGLYITSVAAVILTFTILSGFGRIENRVQRHNIVRIEIIMIDEPCAVGKVFDVFKQLSVMVKDTDVIENSKIGHDVITLDVLLKLPYNVTIEKIALELNKIPEVYDLIDNR